VASGCQYLARKAAPVAEQVEFKSLALADGSTVFAHVSFKGCQDGFPHFWLLDFRSAFGHHQLKLDYSRHQAGEETLVIFNQHRFRAQLPPPLPERRLRQICQTKNSDDEFLVIPNFPMLGDRLQTILETITPNCSIEQKADGFHCKLAYYDADTALTKLTRAHKRLVLRWKRHPYLLARRIAISRKLARAIIADDQEQQLAKICRIVKHSIPDELPLAMRSSRWFEASCLRKGPDRETALLVSLYDAIREIEALSEELRSSSRLGLLSLRIPRQHSPSRDFWVTLKPVTIDRANDDMTIPRKAACWHPLYDESLADHFIANELDLMAEPKRGACRLLVREDFDYLHTQAVHYIKNSIASETEFAVSNGRGKILRLPMGQYHYQIRAHEGAFDDLFFPSHNQSTTSGIVSWQSRRPHPTIRDW
jgi:hypothetical protein